MPMNDAYKALAPGMGIVGQCLKCAENRKQTSNDVD